MRAIVCDRCGKVQLLPDDICFQEKDGELKLRCQWHNIDSAPQAFCSASERKEDRR